MDVSNRLTAWVTANFPRGSSDVVLAVLENLPDELAGGQDAERIQASLVIRTGGDWLQFQRMLALAKMDWRDVLVSADLGNEDWRDRLDAILGT